MNRTVTKIWSGFVNVVVFTVHQLIALLGIGVLSMLLVTSLFDLLKLTAVGATLPRSSLVLTETRMFPVQVVVGFLIGCIGGSFVKHRSASYVWILPSLLLASLMMFGPADTALVRSGAPAASSAWSHYFGGGCEPRQQCFDQIAFTLPFCSALAYSIGATTGRGLSHNKRFRSDRQRHRSSLKTPQGR